LFFGEGNIIAKLKKKHNKTNHLLKYRAVAVPFSKVSGSFYIEQSNSHPFYLCEQKTTCHTRKKRKAMVAIHEIFVILQ
jgi:hypothetical protein